MSSNAKKKARSLYHKVWEASAKEKASRLCGFSDRQWWQQPLQPSQLATNKPNSHPTTTYPTK